MSTKTKLILISALVKLGAATQGTSGNAAILEATLDAPPGSGKYDDFGQAVAVTDGIIVIGAPAANEGMGRAFLYRITDKTNTERVYTPTELTNPRTKKDHGDLDGFGSAVAASNTAVVVGAYNTMGSQGKGVVYRYKTNGFFQSLTPAKIIPKEGIDNFGKSLALLNDKLVVSDPSDRNYRNSVVWTANQKIKAPAPPGQYPSDKWGHSLALSSKVLVVGAPFSDEQGKTSNSGAAYVYAHDESQGLYINPKKLAANDGAQDDLFGWSVAASMDKVYVGTEGSKSVHVYTVSVKDGKINIKKKEKLTKNKEGFGKSLAASGRTLVVGAPGGIGRVYVYKDGNRITTIRNPDAETVKNFGWALAISDNTLVVGTRSNKAYVYDLSKI